MEFEELEAEKPDEVTVFYGPQKFAPVQYHSFDVGPFIMKTQVRPNEAPEQAMARAYAACEAFARKAFQSALPEYLERVKTAAAAARGNR